MSYPRHRDERQVPSAPAFPDVESDVLAYWQADKTFEASIEQRDAGMNGANEFVFYDGPPFANGLPHYGHLITGYVKDVVPRYRTMRGERVERRFGWDCHGLPAEVEAERQLGISHKSEVEQLGVAQFNDACRTSVLRYTDEWQRYVTRQARWVDFENDYKTLDPSYMESVMWAFKTLWDKGLIYEGFRVLWYCWRCETPLSNTETRMDDVYLDRQDPAVTVGLRLETGELALVWTTTPWTLPSNLAVAVHPDVDYVTVEHDGERYLLAAARLEAYAKELGEDAADRVVARVKGRDLAGRTYTPVFDFFVGRANAHQVLLADYVTTEDGTGLVHIAPAFGEEDKVVTDAADIEPVNPVDASGSFTAEVPPYAGMQVFEANKPIIADLKARGALLRHDTYEHPYPHCWRCGMPLIQRAVSSWFVEVTKFRDRMVELNQQINWVPHHVRDGSFGKWLENARDWTISRNRFWGSPIPAWKSDDPAYPRVDVYGSIAELERDFGVRVNDLHRPGIDELTRPNPDDPTGKSTMRRVPEVLDCWFESGSMPFAQVHYPFENADWFEHHYPGDFIVEYLPQVRGWFYTLHVLATALFDRPAFRNCIVHGILQGDDGRKLSKSLRNYPDVLDVFELYGADAMRWGLIASPVLMGGDAIIADSTFRESARQVLLPFWNVWYFFSLYANAENHTATWRTDSTHVLDRYLVAKTHELVDQVTAQLDTYDIPGACVGVRAFLDALTNWYVRRSRERFWSGDRDAFDTLYTVLEVLCRVAAPLLPLVTEEVWRGLTGKRSVHLTDWPDAVELPADAELVAAMDAVRQVCSTALALRKAEGLRVRLPLGALTVATPDAAALEPFAGLIKDEVNVKKLNLDVDVAAHCERVLSVVPRALGPRLGKDVQCVIKAVKAGDWSASEDGVVAGGVELAEGEYELRLVPKDAGVSAALPGFSGVVVLDTDVTPELRTEGTARDVIRAVQQARREVGLDVADRIRLVMAPGDEDLRDAVEAYRQLIMGETLAAELVFGEVPDGTQPVEVGDGSVVRVAVDRVAS